jgi:predicted Holliday junction resolvase-like endonuclease
MFKFLLILLILYILIKVIGNLFLQNPKKKNSNFRFFYQTFKNARDQQKKQQEQAQNRDAESHLDDIEEAEYEDITEEGTKSSIRE